MICCKNLFRRTHPSARSVICLKWVTPLRIAVLASIAADAAYTLGRHGRVSVRAVFLIFLHLLISWIIIGECKRSVDYHRRLAEGEKRRAALTKHAE